MSSWYHLTDNPQRLTTHYGHEAALNPLKLHEVQLHSGGPRLRLRFDLPIFPDAPHPRWPAGANTLQVPFDLFGVAEVEQTGWSTTSRGDLMRERDGSSLRFFFETEVCTLRGRCASACIQHVSAYIDEDAA